MAGGRYDGLVETMGGASTPGVGWAAGVERLAMLLTREPEALRPVAVVPIGAAAVDAALALTQRLRHAGFVVDLGYGGSPGKRMKRANRIAARVAVILGEDELAADAATLRDLDTGEQERVSLDALTERLARYR
jgi:histidyl-tRNA synthetase